MQLGTRWPVGGELPSRIPDALGAAIREVEAELATADTDGWRWTLTWLEGRAVAELDDGTRLHVGHDGAVHRELLD